MSKSKPLILGFIGSLMLTGTLLLFSTSLKADCPSGKIYVERKLTWGFICSGSGTGCFKCKSVDESIQ